MLYAAGRTTDAQARTVAHALTTELKQPVIIENKPDASGIVRAATPDSLANGVAVKWENRRGSHIQTVSRA